MNKAISFNELLEAVDDLPLDDQESLVDIIRHRIADQRREETVKLRTSARDEYQTGKLTPKTPQEIMAEILS